jgi:hypothetical protein
MNKCGAEVIGARQKLHCFGFVCNLGPIFVRVPSWFRSRYTLPCMRRPGANPLILLMLFLSAVAMAMLAYRLMALLVRAAGG